MKVVVDPDEKTQQAIVLSLAEARDELPPPLYERPSEAQPPQYEHISSLQTIYTLLRKVVYGAS